VSRAAQASKTDFGSILVSEAGNILPITGSILAMMPFAAQPLESGRRLLLNYGVRMAEASEFAPAI